jgi:ubiquinone/menaquinone biosynthesis C-methylase UbiE
VGLYREQVLPRLIDRMCGMQGLARWRAQAADGLGGRVVEVGFGSGLNVEHYPAGVDTVFVLEPSRVAMRLAQPRIDRAGVKVEHVGPDGQAIALDDDSCDAGLVTFTLCTVPDPSLVLDELRRVLRPGGRLHFLEHGVAPDASVAAWQRRMEPLQRRLADGCRLTRDPVALVRKAGFAVEDLEQGYVPGPRPWSWFTRGAAANPG